MQSGETRWQALAAAAAGLAIVVTLAAAFTLVLGSGTRAGAETPYLAAFGAHYPGAAGSRISSCLLCHTNPLGGEHAMNPYGNAVGENLNFQAVEGRDSDGDGYTNLQEIRALTFPGNPADNPATVVTTTTVPGGTTTTAAPGSGGALYASDCAACHGASGGNLVPTTLSRSQLVSVIGAGRGGMPGFSATLTAAQMGSIADALIGWSQSPTTTQAGGSTTTTTAGSTSGAAVYSSYCGGCHGGAGGNLVGSGLGTSQIAAITTSGRGGMPGFGGTLTTAQINAVAAYLASLGQGGTTTTAGGTTTTGAPGSGGALYAANCASCHGAAGGNLAGAGLGASQIAAITTSGSGSMPGFSGNLTAAEINAIAGYVAGLGSGGTTTTVPSGSTTTAVPGSGAALYAADCAGCHGQAGEGGVGGAILGSNLGDAAIRALIRDGAGGMPAFGDRLSVEDIATLAAYTAGLASGGTTTTSPGATTTAPADGGTGVVGDGTASTPWLKVTLAAVLALLAAAGVGFLLLRSARHIFRT
jgi:mono/diheme cytochrome c family protein